MGEHVDVVLNDYPNSVQRCVAIVTQEGDELIVKDCDGVTDATVRRVAEQAVVAGKADPLRTFTVMLTGSRLFALEPHAWDRCPFQSTSEVPMEPVSTIDELLEALG